MYFHEGTTSFLKWLLVIVAFGLFLWWIRHDFGANVALIAVVLCAGTIFFIAGSFLSAYIQKATMDQISRFNAQDATIDRFRMQSLRETVKADSIRVKVDAQKELLDYKNQQKQLTQQQKQLTQQQKQLPEESTFWSTNDTVDLEDWS